MTSTAQPAAPPVVSVVVCTRNRSADLRKALESLVVQSPDSPEFEVIVVDNASTDDTRAVAMSFGDRLQLTCLVEPQIGLCHARNTGWKRATGNYVAYFDDDAIACRGWIAAVVAAFESTSGTGVVGGRVDPIWEARRPDWLSDRVALGLTIVDWSDAPKIIDDLGAEWLVGANMAIRADVLRQVGGFRPELDRVGSRMLSSGDVFLLKEITRRGYRCLYYPDMAIQHLAAATRLNKRWFRSRYYWQGISDAVMELIETRPTRGQRLALGLRALGLLLRRPGRVSTLLPTDDPDAFAETCWTLIAIGRVVGLLGVATVGPSGPPDAS